MNDYNDVRLRTLLTVCEVAVFLGVSERTVRRYIHEGRLSAVRLKHQLRISRTDLDEMLFGRLLGGKDEDIPTIN